MDFIAVSMAGKADAKAERANEKAIKVEESTKVLKSVAYTGYVEEGRLEGSVVGENSTAEGSDTTASYYCSHAEGEDTIAGGYCSHAEGIGATASGNSSHAEGAGTTASGDGSHAEGAGTTASGHFSHAEGGYPVDIGSMTVEGTTAKGINAHAEGCGTSATGDCSHAEGYSTKAMEKNSHAEGAGSAANGIGAHAEGGSTICMGDYCHAEGSLSKAQGDSSHAEGYKTSAIGRYSHAEGDSSSTGGSASHAEGKDTEAGGWASHSEGAYSYAKGAGGHAGGYFTIAGEYQYAIGTYNIESTGGMGTAGDVFIIGNGADYNARSNAFRVSAEGSVYAAKTYNSNGADYAELFEWQDGNASAEDRRGLFVSMDGEYIRLSDSPSDYILGIVSAAPAMLGNQFADYWNGMYEVDIFGSPLYQEMTFPAITDHDGNVIVPESKFMNLKINPNYDFSKPYVPRDKRKEWAMVGMIGKLVMVDDGTCVVNGYCQPSTGGKATKADSKTDYRVIARLDETHIKVLIK